MIPHRIPLAVAAALAAGPALAHPGHGPAAFPAGVLHQIVSLDHLPAAVVAAALAASGVALAFVLRRRARLSAVRAATAPGARATR